jgi:hypothetical protein
MSEAAKAVKFINVKSAIIFIYLNLNLYLDVGKKYSLQRVIYFRSFCGVWKFQYK